MCNLRQIYFPLLHIVHKEKKGRFMMNRLTKILQAGGTQNITTHCMHYFISQMKRTYIVWYGLILHIIAYEELQNISPV